MERCKIGFPTSAKDRTVFVVLGTIFGAILFLAGRHLLGRQTENKTHDDVVVKMSHKDFPN